MEDTAREFLARVMPEFPTGGQAYLNIHWSQPNSRYDPEKPDGPGNPAKSWGGRAHTSLDAVAETLAWVGRMSAADAYVCMSLQGRAEPKIDSRGKPYNRALRFADAVVSLQSFYIDVDVKENAYATTDEALAAAWGFMKTVGLPAPTALVKSGSGGFHIHWVVDEPLTRDKWQPLADALSTAVQAHGLIADTQCTVDSARILRIPGTKNFKHNPPRDVELTSLGKQIPLVDMKAVLLPFMGVARPGRTASALTGSPSAGSSPFEQAGVLPLPSDPSAAEANLELGAGVSEPMVDDIKIGDVIKSCAYIARVIGTGGIDEPQPLWFLTAAVAGFLEDGRQVFHQMSEKHSGYTVPATDSLFDRISISQKARNIGWPQCSKIAGYGAKECQSCPLLKLGKSPLNFVVPVATTGFDATLPEKYSRNNEGVVVRQAMDEAGQLLTIPVCNYPIWGGWLSNNPWTFHFTTKTESGRKTLMEVPTEVIFQKDGMNKYLGSKGIFCTEPQYKMTKEFFVAWLQKLQGQKDSVISAAPFGWSVVDGKVEGFTYAGRVWMARDDRPAANPNPVLAYQYTPKGDLNIWRDIAKVIYEQKRPGLDAILAVAFAGPLVRFTGFSGLILNSYSAESGIGKTTAMKVSQAVWGNPVLAMQGLNDTTNSVLGKMGQIRSLPVFWDEIKTENQVKRFCGIVFELTGGREKTRMNADTTLKLSGTWQTLMVSASNDSLIDGMAREVGSTTAGLHRLFEFSIPKPASMSRDIGVVQRLLGKLDDNYGAAGLVYAKFLGAHWQRVEQEVAKLQDELYTEVVVKQEERMWIATMAVVLKGAEYANTLGLTDIDLVGLRAFLMETLVTMRGMVSDSPSDLNNDMSVSTILAEFLNSNRSRNTLITNRIWVSRGKPPAGSIKIISSLDKLGDILIQIGRDDKLIRISSTALTRWMGERNYSRHTFLKRLEDEFGLKKVNGKLGGGTEISCAMEHLLELDMNHPKLSIYVE